MADSSLMPAIIGLAGTTSGAILGFGGGLITQLLLERKKQEAENKKKKAEKLEELVTAVNDFRYKVENAFDDDGYIGLFSKIEAIQRVYFQEFSQLTYKIEDEYLKMDKITTTKGADAAEKRFIKLMYTLDDYLDEISKYAKREFQ
jgi:hypothetical protein